jgi:ubiquinone/menaquinone biosynthesis C-methylase UbiE
MDTRDSYDAIAANYQKLVAGELPGKVFDRAMLAAFAELILAGQPAPVADIGCGPGHVTSHLSSLGLDAFGIDVSSGMIDVARAAHPALRFETGTMTALTLPDASLAGIVARYSTIHLTDAELPIAFGEFYRVLAPEGHVLLDFQVGNERIERTEAYGRPVSITAFRRPVAAMVTALESAGFDVIAQLSRAPDSREKVEQCHLIARRWRVAAELADQRGL